MKYLLKSTEQSNVHMNVNPVNINVRTFNILFINFLIIIIMLEKMYFIKFLTH